MSSPPSDRRPGYGVARYVAALLLLLYGFGKITGAQFTVLDSELDKPLREVSGFWLTWYYFGYSPVYGTVIALVQIGGAVALLIRRTALIGALALLPVIANIILVDVFYGIGLSPLVAAVLIACCLLRVLAAHKDRIAHLLLPPQAEQTLQRKVLTGLVGTAMVLLSFAYLYYVANYNNRHPTPIDGTWRVTTAGTAATPYPTHVYFERNRAFMCVFRYPRRTATHHFEVDPQRSRVRIWASWLTRGPLLLEGTYDPSADTLRLTGRLSFSRQPVTLDLAKVRPPTP